MNFCIWLTRSKEKPSTVKAKIIEIRKRKKSGLPFSSFEILDVFRINNLEKGQKGSHPHM
jgi:hypothetical protein